MTALTWQHTPGASGVDSEFVDHCIDCSEAAGEWVGWPCSAARLVKAAVEVDRYLRGMDEEARVARAVNEALTEAADAIEAVAEEAMSATSRSFHPQGTHADGRRDGCWEGRTDAARIVRTRRT